MILVKPISHGERYVNIDEISQITPDGPNCFIIFARSSAKRLRVRGSAATIFSLIQTARLGRLAPHTAAVCEMLSEALSRPTKASEEHE